MIDPGFRQPIRTTAYPGDWLTRDGRYKVPKGATAMPKFSCTRSDEYSNVATASSLAESMSKDVSVSGGVSVLGVGGGAFSSSTGWQSSKNEEQDNSFYKFESKSCKHRPTRMRPSFVSKPPCAARWATLSPCLDVLAHAQIASSTVLSGCTRHRRRRISCRNSSPRQ